MKSNIPFWIEVWLGASAVICTLDVLYTMLRPITTRGGELACFYSLCRAGIFFIRAKRLGNIYADVDLRYADPNDVVTMATGRVMIIEIVMNLVALVLVSRSTQELILNL